MFYYYTFSELDVILSTGSSERFIFCIPFFVLHMVRIGIYHCLCLFARIGVARAWCMRYYPVMIHV